MRKESGIDALGIQDFQQFAEELDVGYEVMELQVTLKVRELAPREKTLTMFHLIFH